VVTREVKFEDNEKDFLIELVGHQSIVDFGLVDQLVNGGNEFTDEKLYSLRKMLEDVPRTEVYQMEWKGKTIDVNARNTAGNIFFRINKVLGISNDE
jgi:hypothetical protein